jgi:regulator of replication initiation timing
MKTVGDEIFEREQALKAKDKQIEALKKTLDASVEENKQYQTLLRYVAYQRLPLGSTVIETLPEHWQERVSKILD